MKLSNKKSMSEVVPFIAVAMLIFLGILTLIVPRITNSGEIINTNANQVLNSDQNEKNMYSLIKEYALQGKYLDSSQLATEFILKFPESMYIHNAYYIKLYSLYKLYSPDKGERLKSMELFFNTAEEYNKKFKNSLSSFTDIYSVTVLTKKEYDKNEFKNLQYYYSDLNGKCGDSARLLKFPNVDKEILTNYPIQIRFLALYKILKKQDTLDYNDYEFIFDEIFCNYKAVNDQAIKEDYSRFYESYHFEFKPEIIDFYLANYINTKISSQYINDDDHNEFFYNYLNYFSKDSLIVDDLIILYSYILLAPYEAPLATDVSKINQNSYYHQPIIYKNFKESEYLKEIIIRRLNTLKEDSAYYYYLNYLKGIISMQNLSYNLAIICLENHNYDSWNQIFNYSGLIKSGFDRNSNCITKFPSNQIKDLLQSFTDLKKKINDNKNKNINYYSIDSKNSRIISKQKKISDDVMLSKQLALTSNSFELFLSLLYTSIYANNQDKIHYFVTLHKYAKDNSDEYYKGVNYDKLFLSQVIFPEEFIFSEFYNNNIKKIFLTKFNNKNNYLDLIGIKDDQCSTSSDKLYLACLKLNGFNLKDYALHMLMRAEFTKYSLNLADHYQLCRELKTYYGNFSLEYKNFFDTLQIKSEFDSKCS